LLAAAIASTFSAGAMAADPVISFNRLWTHSHADTVGQTSEIPAFDRKTNTLWVAGVVGVDVLDADTGNLVEHIDVSGYGSINSVAVHNGLAAFAIEASGDRRDAGVVVFYDTRTRALSGDVSSVTVGALPDMLAFTHDGSKLLVANEATPNPVADVAYASPDPAGSVSIIDMATRSVVATAGFDGVPMTGSNLRTNIGMDFEPEYIAIDEEGTMAFVTLQEANGVGVLDLVSNAFTEVIGLGLKDFSLPGNAIDPSHKDGKIELRAAAVKGLYQPDGIAAYTVRGQTYLVTANEGDTREDDGDKKRVKDAGLPGYPADLNQLNIATTDSTSGTDLVTFGARSFSIRDAAGNLVFDSGNVLDAEAIKRGIYDDGRSDDKGVEPEGVALLDIAGHTLAFVGLERTTRGAVAVFDITDPANASFVDMIVTDGDVAPEGLAAYQYRGNFYLAIANEVSNTTSLYSIERVLPIPAH
jgi:DNA-binding beta-propeller fold protein YncE